MWVPTYICRFYSTPSFKGTHSLASLVAFYTISNLDKRRMIIISQHREDLISDVVLLLAGSSSPPSPLIGIHELIEMATSWYSWCHFCAHYTFTSVNACLTYGLTIRIRARRSRYI